MKLFLQLFLCYHFDWLTSVLIISLIFGFVIIIVIKIFKVVKVSIVHVEIVFIVVASASSKGCLTKIIGCLLLFIILL